MLYGIMPHLMETKFKAELKERDRRIEQLEKIVAYDVKEIKLLKSRLAALGEPVERTDYLSFKATLSGRVSRDSDKL